MHDPRVPIFSVRTNITIAGTIFSRYFCCMVAPFKKGSHKRRFARTHELALTLLMISRSLGISSDQALTPQNYV